MSYVKQFPEDSAGFEPLSEIYCFACGKHLGKSKPIVVYDGRVDHPTEKYKTSGVSIFMHLSCANAMAQRLITDRWVNRGDWQNELLNLK